MECPHCRYEDTLYGAYIDQGRRRAKTLGVHGRFFRPDGNSMHLTRKTCDYRAPNYVMDIAGIVGCPRCS